MRQGTGVTVSVWAVGAGLVCVRGRQSTGVCVCGGGGAVWDVCVCEGLLNTVTFQVCVCVCVCVRACVRACYRS